MKDHETPKDMVQVILIETNRYFSNAPQLIQLHKTYENQFQDQIAFVRVCYDRLE